MEEMMNYYNEDWIKSQLTEGKPIFGSVSIHSGRLFLCDPSYVYACPSNSTAGNLRSPVTSEKIIHSIDVGLRDCSAK